MRNLLFENTDSFTHLSDMRSECDEKHCLFRWPNIMTPMRSANIEYSHSSGPIAAHYRCLSTTQYCQSWSLTVLLKQQFSVIADSHEELILTR